MGGLFGGAPSAPARHTAADWRRIQGNAGDLVNSPFFAPLLNPTADQIIPDAPPTADLTDDEIQKARAAAMRRAVMGQGLSSSFLTGSLGDMTAPTTSKSTLGGM